MFKRLTCLLFFLLPLAASAQAIYKCKDAGGHVMTSDRPIPECADRAMQVLGKDGLVRREIPAPLTAEEKRRQQDLAEKQKAAELASAEKARADLALTTRYRSEADIEIAHTRATAGVVEQVRRDKLAVEQAEERLAETLKGVERSKATGGLKLRIEQAEAALKEKQKSLAARSEERDQLDKKFAQTLQRYREINGTK